MSSALDQDLRRSAEQVDWYHSIDLAPGLTTRGQVDCRGIVDRTLLPARLDGLRVLDVGTWDGFWAFELERRGAEVVTLDVPDPAELDWPPRTTIGAAAGAWQERMATFTPGAGFDVAAKALGSKVQRVQVSIYDVGSADLGEFDLIFVGSILVHLRDPVAALTGLRSVARGPIVVNDAIDLVPTVLSPRTPRARFVGDGDLVLWWHPNLAALTAMVRAAGFDVVERSRVFFIPWGEGYGRPSPARVMKSLLSPQGREMVVTWALGIPHSSLLCEPIR